MLDTFGGEENQDLPLTTASTCEIRQLRLRMCYFESN